MKQYSKATFDIIEAISLLATLRASGNQFAIIKADLNKNHTFSVLKFNPILDKYENWCSSYAQPTNPILFDKSLHPTELDLMQNFTSVWSNAESLSKSKRIMKKYYYENIMPVIQSGGIAGGDFAIRKEDFYKLRPDLDRSNCHVSNWTWSWKPRNKKPLYVPCDGISYGVYIMNRFPTKEEISEQAKFIFNNIDFKIAR